MAKCNNRIIRNRLRTSHFFCFAHSQYFNTPECIQNTRENVNGENENTRIMYTHAVVASETKTTTIIRCTFANEQRNIPKKHRCASATSHRERE